MRRDAHVPARLAVRLLRQNPEIVQKSALVSSLSRLARLLGGGRRPERTGLVPSMRLLPLVGRPEELAGVRETGLD